MKSELNGLITCDSPNEECCLASFRQVWATLDRTYLAEAKNRLWLLNPDEEDDRKNGLCAPVESAIASREDVPVHTCSYLSVFSYLFPFKGLCWTIALVMQTVVASSSHIWVSFKHSMTFSWLTLGSVFCFIRNRKKYIHFSSWGNFLWAVCPQACQWPLWNQPSECEHQSPMCD